MAAVGVSLFRQYPPASSSRLGDEVLLVKRKNEPKKGSWALPGGLMELGE